MTARARAIVSVLLTGAVLASTSTQAGSLRFNGFGNNDLDRVKIRVDPPGPPADIGAGDFTIEFWIKGTGADNPNSINANRCGPGVYGWIDGNIVIDRDRFNLPRAWGLSLGDGRIVFGANVNNTNIATHCGTRNVLDGQWHHVAVTRSASGTIRLFVDGVPDGSPTGGVGGDLSYPDNGQSHGPTCGTQPCANSDPYLVIGAEKHDARPGQLAFRGLLDELRLSRSLRYTTNFIPPTVPFSPDANTAALYHFDEATTGDCTTGTVINDAAGGGSPGECRFGGTPGGPVWSADSPFPDANSPGSLQFSAASYPTSEGAGARIITVTRTSGSAGAVSINYSTGDGTGATPAIAPSDYTTSIGTLMWDAGDTAPKTFNVPIIDDGMPEPAETFSVGLSGPSGGATRGTPFNATVTIADNDSPGLFQFETTGFQVAEANGMATITVNRTNGAIGAVSVNYASSNGTAFSPGDYGAVAGTLNWVAGEDGPKTFTVSVVNDTVVEGNETLSLALSGATGNATISPPGAATLTIVDDDLAQPGTLQLAQATFSVGEASGTLAITVSRMNGTDGPAQVTVATTNGVATAGADFQLLSQTLTWAAGEGVSKTATLTILDDAADEPAETFTVGLINVTGATLGTPASATITINDNDAPINTGGDSDGGGAVDPHFLLLGALAVLLHARRRRGILRTRL